MAEETQGPPPIAPATPAPTANGTAAAAAPVAAPSPAEPAKARSPLVWLYELVWPPTTPHTHQTEWHREVAETIVFVVVLVLLLKSFAAEAFVIPTGSMAETLWGYQKIVTCPQCGHTFPVNCGNDVENNQADRAMTCQCPNCRFPILLPEGYPYTSGDRVLVAKSLWESGLMDPERLDVTVFKFPGESRPGSGRPTYPRSGPEKEHQAMNYIKRLIGKPGETIGIYYGNLYTATNDQPDEDDLKAAEEKRVWMAPFMHEDKFKTQLEQQNPMFHILRKKAAKVLAMRRIVYDNAHQAKDLKEFPRWGSDPAGAWQPAGDFGFRVAPGADGTAWLRYNHLIRTLGGPNKVAKELITDFMGYNSADNPGFNGQNWVGELILDCDVTVEDPTGTFILELSKGTDRFRAVFDLATGNCTLRRLDQNALAQDAWKKDPEKGEKLGDTVATPLKGKGRFAVRFANVDEQLILWVNGTLPFGENGVNYPAPKSLGPTTNDLQPVSIGATAGVQVEGLKLWRDTYYTVHGQSPDCSPGCPDLGDSNAWGALQRLPAKTLYVQPGHYLCLGDNSPSSSDGRTWGLVPERLLLGRALFVYYPFYAPFPPFSAPINRVGPIR